MKATYHVYRQHPGRNYGVYRQPGRDGSGQELVEGGFFSRKAAERSRDEHQRAEPGLTAEQKRFLDSLTEQSVPIVYTGKPGCACGCRGTYRYRGATAKQAGRDRGYAVEPEEVNDVQVRRVLRELQTAPVDGDWVVGDDLEFFSLTVGNRVRTLYTTRYLS